MEPRPIKLARSVCRHIPKAFSSTPARTAPTSIFPTHAVSPSLTYPQGKVIAVWPVGGASANFPMAVDSDSNHVLSVFRNPPKLGVFDKRDGSIVRMGDACGDADDVFVDAKRHRVYISCGAGVIDIFDARSYERLSRIPTASGARTSLFVPELDRLFVAVRAAGSNPAGIWVLRPEP